MPMYVNTERLLEIYQAVKARPGITAAAISRQLNDDRASLYRSLARMDRYGLFLYEDDRGGLYPF